MNANEIIINGTLRVDGTLELEGKPVMAPGQVQVVLRREANFVLPRESWWAFMQRSRADLERASVGFMDDDEVAAHIASLREAS